MIKQYQHGRFFRILWFILFPFTLAIGGVVWAVWPAGSRGWLLLVEVFILLYSIYALWSLVGSFAQVSLSPDEVVVRQFGRIYHLPYNSLQSVRRNELALIMQTATKTIYIERHIANVFDLMAELVYRAPALKVGSKPAIQQPLPHRINGRIRNFFFALGIVLLSFFVGGGIVWSALAETGWKMAMMLFFAFWCLLVGGLFLYLCFSFTWRITLLPDKIVLRFPFHARQLQISDLASVRLAASSPNGAGSEESLALELTLTNGRSLRLTQQELSIPLPHLLEMLVYHYQLPMMYEKVPDKVHHTLFGAGSRRPFPDYLNGESGVAVRSIEEICRWLQQCEYVRDAELFNQRDVWQHPGEFEKRRQGDCEDHALWAWRKLHELNIAAEFVVGRAQLGDGVDGGHAWVSYRENGRTYILETTHKSQLIYPQDAIQSQYSPRFSIDQDLQTYRFVPVAVGEGNESDRAKR